MTLCQTDPPVKSYVQISFLPNFPILITVQFKGMETYSNISLIESIQRISDCSNLIFVKRSNVHLRKAIVMVTTKSILKMLGDGDIRNLHLCKVIVNNDVDPDVDAVDGDGDGDS